MFINSSLVIDYSKISNGKLSEVDNKFGKFKYQRFSYDGVPLRFKCKLDGQRIRESKFGGHFISIPEDKEVTNILKSIYKVISEMSGQSFTLKTHIYEDKEYLIFTLSKNFKLIDIQNGEVTIKEALGKPLYGHAVIEFVILDSTRGKTLKMEMSIAKADIHKDKDPYASLIESLK